MTASPHLNPPSSHLDFEEAMTYPSEFGREMGYAICRSHDYNTSRRSPIRLKPNIQLIG